MDYKAQVTNSILSVLNDELSSAEVYEKLEKPKTLAMGDLAFPAFSLAKVFHKAPNAIAEELVSKIDQSSYEKVEAKGAYLNFFLDKGNFSNEILNEVLEEGSAYVKTTTVRVAMSQSTCHHLTLPNQFPWVICAQLLLVIQLPNCWLRTVTIQSKITI